MVLVGDGTRNLKDESVCVCVCVHAHMHFQLCPTLCDPVDCGLPGFSLHGISQARILEGGCHFLLQGIFLTQDLTWVSCVSCIGRQILYHYTTQEAQRCVCYILKEEEA